MTYYPQIYTSPTYAYLSRQGHSYPAEESPPPPRSTYTNVPIGSKHAGSLSRSNKISPQLFPLISKFEALDLLSYKIQIPPLRPAPPHTSRNSLPRRGGLHVPVSMTLEEIFSPRRKPRQSYGNDFWKDVVASLPEDRFMSSLVKRSGSRRSEQIQSANEVNSVNVPGGIPPSNLSNSGKGDIGTRIPKYISEERDIGLGTRNSSIVNEMVKFFDGCVERSDPYLPSRAEGSPFSAATATNSKTKLSFLQNIAPTTPPHHNVVKSPSTVLTAGGSRLKATSINSGTPQTPTRYNPTHDTRKRQSLEETPYPFLQIPHGYGPSRRMSAMTLSTGQKIDKGRHVDFPLYENGKILNPDQKYPSLEDTNSRRRLQEEPLSSPGNSTSKERIIGKPEAVHQSQGLEKAANSRADQKVSSDSDMKMLRERSVVAKSLESRIWSIPKSDDTKTPKPRCRDFSHATPSAPLVRAPYPSCSFAPSDSKIQFQSRIPNLAERSTIAKAGGVSSKIAQISRKRTPCLVQRTQVCPPTSAKAVCRSSYDKIKIWERKKEIKRKIEEKPAEICSSRPLDKFVAARRSIYENSCTVEVGKELKKRGLDWQEVQAVMNDFQDIGAQLGNDTTTGTWKMVVASKLGRGGLADQDDGETYEAFGDVDMRIIVREVQCEMTEPKPLHLTEIRKMILLCRELDPSNSLPQCKERGSWAYPMKG